MLLQQKTSLLFFGENQSPKDKLPTNLSGTCQSSVVQFSIFLLGHSGLVFQIVCVDFFLDVFTSSDIQ